MRGDKVDGVVVSVGLLGAVAGTSGVGRAFVGRVGEATGVGTAERRRGGTAGGGARQRSSAALGAERRSSVGLAGRAVCLVRRVRAAEYRFAQSAVGRVGWRRVAYAVVAAVREAS